MEETLTLEDVKEASESLKKIISPTPVKYSTTFSQKTGNSVYLKAENLQKTGSFKIRGAYNKIKNLSRRERNSGIIAVSAGNHGQGVALAASILGLEATIVMPEKAPSSKIAATQSYGGKVILKGNNYEQSQEWALEKASKENLVMIHPFNDPLVIAGQGTMGLEILKEVEGVQAIVVPVGGGGLISGIGLAVKELNPRVKIIGVQAASCPAALESFKSGSLVSTYMAPTIADGIAVKRPGNITFQHINKYVDKIITVEEKEIARAILMLLERNKLLVEGAGAVGLAALLTNKIPLKDQRVVLVLSGGNIDITLLETIIQSFSPSSRITL